MLEAIWVQEPCKNIYYLWDICFIADTISVTCSLHGQCRKLQHNCSFLITKRCFGVHGASHTSSILWQKWIIFQLLKKKIYSYCTRYSFHSSGENTSQRDLFKVRKGTRHQQGVTADAPSIPSGADESEAIIEEGDKLTMDEQEIFEALLRKCCLTMDNKSMMKGLFRQWRFKPSQKWLSMVSKLHQHKARLWWELFQRHAGLQLSGDANNYLQFFKKYRLKVWLAEFMTHMFLANNFLHLQRPLLISPCSSSPCSYMMEFRTWLYWLPCCTEAYCWINHW